jgi:hypothetical protein
VWMIASTQPKVPLMPAVAVADDEPEVLSSAMEQQRKNLNCEQSEDILYGRLGRETVEQSSVTENIWLLNKLRVYKGMGTTINFQR